MASGHDAQSAGERIETLLADLRSHAGPQVAETAEELVSCLVELYGAGLAEIVTIIGKDVEAGPRLMDSLVADPLVESLLLLHDLHPTDIGSRTQRAIDEVLPQFGSHAPEVEYLGVDDEGGIHLRVKGGGSGCGASPETIHAAIEESVMAAAPEAASVHIEVAEVTPELPLLQISRRPAAFGGAL
jgi:Fe-S cluster biogenesis protein NfuA